MLLDFSLLRLLVLTSRNLDRTNAMRTVYSLLAVLGSLASVNALAPFNVGSCASAAATRTLTPAVATNGAWNCFAFSVGKEDNQVATLDLPIEAEGAVLQVYAWNSAQEGGNTADADYRWYQNGGSFNGRRWLKLALPQNNPTDLNGLPSSWGSNDDDRYNAVINTVDLTAIPGWTSALHEEGVYAYYGDTGLNPGRNVLVLQHPSVAAPGSVGAFTGSLLWRLVYPDTAGINGVIVPGTGGDYSPEFGTLSLNRAVEVNDLISPGSGISLQVSEQFARIGWAIRGFQYTAAVSGTGLAVGNMSANAWMANTPMVTGWTGVGTANCSTQASNCRQNAAGGQFLNANYTENVPAVYGAANGNISHDTSTANTDAVTRTWDVPLDFATGSTNWGQLPFTVPAFMQWGVDWTQQTTPFLQVTLTVTWVNDYPMLSSLSDAVFRNYDTNTNMGHDVRSPNFQTPSRIYRVQTNSMWWRATVRFSNVVNLNTPTGAPADTPACDPLWEVQRVSDWSARVYSNGYNSAWTASGGALANFDFDQFTTSANSGAAFSKRWITNNYWTNTNNFDGVLVPELAPTRNVWLLVRISAAKDVTSGGAQQQCGSNNIRVGSASFSTSGVTDQCSAPSDCLVDASNNPNKDQADQTANAGINAAARFSSCAFKLSVGPQGRRVPTTKCVECLNDNQCGDGQYCHLDNGICRGMPNTYYYNCDSDSGKLYGLCIAKSTEVLGRRCRAAYTGSAGSLSAPITVSVIGGVSYTREGATGPAFDSTNTMDEQFAVKGDAANADFAVGGTGACGEWRFYNGTTRFDNQNNWQSSNNRVRYALWTGVCHRGRCVECFPGNRFSSAGGKACLNGRTFSAMDVDGTVRTFAEDTNAGTELGTTSMVILLLIVFWMYMYAEAKRWRAANGKPPMTCCECLCCCDACTKFDGASNSTANPAAK